MPPTETHPQQARDIASRELYRYRAYRRNGPEELRHLLKAGEVRFSDPSSFNDPWDCRPRFHAPANDVEARVALAVLAQGIAGRDATKAEAQELAEALDCASDPSRFKSAMQALAAYFQSAVQGRYRMLCLSARNDVPLMWGHYADSHRGLCLVFDTDHPVIAKATRVSYSEQYPAHHPGIQERDYFHVLFLNKALFWGYEHEYRIVACRNLGEADEFASCDDLGYVSVGAESLTGVVIGCQMDSRDRRELRRHLDSAQHEIKVYEARVQEDGYSLDIVRTS